MTFFFSILIVRSILYYWRVEIDTLQQAIPVFLSRFHRNNMAAKCRKHGFNFVDIVSFHAICCEDQRVLRSDLMRFVWHKQKVWDYIGYISMVLFLQSTAIKELKIKRRAIRYVLLEKFCLIIRVCDTFRQTRNIIQSVGLNQK